MRRADRLFQLVQLLRTRRTATGQQLADELRVSKRTVYRDIRDLEIAGVPIRGEAGVGYRLDRAFELPPLTFTSEELQGLVLGARIVASWGDSELAQAVGRAMLRIESVLPETLRDVLIETPLFAPGRGHGAIMAREVAVMRRAIAESRLLHLSYTTPDGRDSERDVRPLGLYFWGNRWTLAAWCELRQDYRSFRPDCIRELDLLQETFDPADGINLADFLARMDDMEGGAHQQKGR